MAMNIKNTVDRGIILISAAKLVPMNAQAAAWDPDTGGAETFGDHCRLSATGADPATHYGANTRATQQMKNAISGQAHAPSVAVYWESDGWTWEAAIADAGLQRIESEVH